MTTGYNIREGSAELAERIRQELYESGSIYECPGCGRALDCKTPTNEREWEAPATWCQRCGGTATLLSSTARQEIVDKVTEALMARAEQARAARAVLDTVDALEGRRTA